MTTEKKVQSTSESHLTRGIWGGEGEGGVTDVDRMKGVLRRLGALKLFFFSFYLFFFSCFVLLLSLLRRIYDSSDRFLYEPLREARDV